MTLVADESGNVTGAQLLRIVVDEGVESSLAMALRRKLRITAPVPPRTVSCFVAALLRFWSLPRCPRRCRAGGSASDEFLPRCVCTSPLSRGVVDDPLTG
jgi:hypothetical protein